MKKFFIVSGVLWFLAASATAHNIDLSIRSYANAKNQNNVAYPSLSVNKKIDLK